jgi:hypothetical protein
MNKGDIKKAYLAAVGNPETGVFVEFADVIAEAIAKECCEEETKTVAPVKEIRVVKADETR